MKPSRSNEISRLRLAFLSSLSFLSYITFTLLLLLSSQTVWAADITLAWNPNTEEDLSGYRIYYREEGQNYDYQNPAWEGTATTCTIPDLNNNTTYYFIARAFDTSNNESEDSDEACYRPNRPPVLNPIGAKTVDEGQLLAFTITANDPDGDNLLFSASNVPTGAAFDSAAQTFTWNPGYGAEGNYTVTFTVTDNGTPIQSDSEQVTITVGNVNRPPVLNPIGGRSVDEGQPLAFTITANDPDGDNLVFSASNLPTGASFDSAAQTFSWNPGYGAEGNYTVTFTVTDNGTPIQSDSEQVTITVGNVNRPPVLNPIGGRSVDEGQPLAFTITANDPDGDNLVFSASNLPTGASFDSAAQTFSWNPGYGAAGNYTVTFTVTDNGTPTQSDSEQVTIGVSGDEDGPAAPANLRVIVE